MQATAASLRVELSQDDGVVGGLPNYRQQQKVTSSMLSYVLMPTRDS